jgi:hypothetical protein
LTNSDGLLLNTFVKDSGLDIKQAQWELDQWTQQILNHLANGQKAHLLGIGTLWNDAQGQLQFVPSEKFIADFTSFGLGNIHLPAKRSFEPSSGKSKTAWKKLAAAASIALLLASGLVVFQNNANQADTAGWNPDLTAVKADQVNHTPIPDLNTATSEKNFQKEFLDLWNAAPIEIAPIKTAEKIEKESTSATKANANAAAVNHKETVKTSSEWGKSWVVGGVFKSKINADDQVTQMRSQGFANAKVIPFQDYFYAVYGTAKNEKEEAQLRAKVLTVDPRAWTKR